MAGIENIKELTEAVCAVKNVGGKVLEDGKVNWKDTQHFPAMLGAFEEFTDVDYTKLAEEGLDIDDTEKAEWVGFYAERLDLPQDNWEAAFEKGFATVVEVASAVVTLLNLWKSSKPA